MRRTLRRFGEHQFDGDLVDQRLNFRGGQTATLERRNRIANRFLARFRVRSLLALLQNANTLPVLRQIRQF